MFSRNIAHQEKRSIQWVNFVIYNMSIQFHKRWKRIKYSPRKTTANVCG